MIIAHCNCVAVVVMLRNAFFIGLNDLLVCFRVFILYPCKQCRAEIKVQVFIIIYFEDNFSCLIKYIGFGIGQVTLMIYPFIPVMEGCCAWLQLNFTGPGVFSRRLVKMTVYADKNIIQIRQIKRYIKLINRNCEYCIY